MDKPYLCTICEKQFLGEIVFLKQFVNECCILWRPYQKPGIWEHFEVVVVVLRVLYVL